MQLNPAVPPPRLDRTRIPFMPASPVATFTLLVGPAHACPQGRRSNTHESERSLMTVVVPVCSVERTPRPRSG
jgi:hypothetical protein